MAIRKAKLENELEFIHPLDDVIDLDKSDIELYKETWDTKHLEITGEPVKFKIRFNLPYQSQIEIDNAITRSREGLTIGDYQQTVVKHVLLDIVNADEDPDNIIAKREHGVLSKSTLKDLTDTGLIGDIFSFYLYKREQMQGGRNLLKKG